MVCFYDNNSEGFLSSCFALLLSPLFTISGDFKFTSGRGYPFVLHILKSEGFVMMNWIEIEETNQFIDVHANDLNNIHRAHHIL